MISYLQEKVSTKGMVPRARFGYREQLVPSGEIFLYTVYLKAFGKGCYKLMTSFLLITIAFICIILILCYYFSRKKIRFNKKEKYFKQLFQNVNDLELSKKDRQQGKDDFTLTHGSIEFESFAHMLAKAQPQANEVFVDLGSGIGKAVIAASLLYDFKECLGIEILPSLYQQSVELKHQTQNNRSKITFIHDDFYSFDIGQADIVFIHATGFFGEALDKLNQYLNNMKQGSRLIITSKEINNPKFKLIHQQQYKMSWGFSRISIYSVNLPN